MKKFLYLPLLLLVLFISVNKVSADSTIYISNLYNDYPFLTTIDSSIVSNLETYYTNNFSSSYSYYYIYYNSTSNELSLATTSKNQLWVYGSISDYTWGSNRNGSFPCYSYNFSTTSYSSTCASLSPTLIYKTSVDFTYNAPNVSGTFSSMQTPSYSNLNLDISFPQMNIEDGDIIPTYMSLTNGPTADFIEVNLSNYDYIILSLKNYNQQPFNTTIFSLGSLCFTPVYNYGMTQKNELYPGYQVQACTEDYTSTTPVSIYVIQADLDNNAVYYIKKSNSSTNIVNIPTSVFDITYITSENATDPQVSIGGRSYPVIPFSDLTDTANKSTDEGYISGQVCSLGDVNCQASQNGMDISELFTQPLQILKTLWGSIINVFTLITTFIGLLPITLQAFLYSAFMLAIVLGICKIIL